MKVREKKWLQQAHCKNTLFTCKRATKITRHPKDKGWIAAEGLYPLGLCAHAQELLDHAATHSILKILPLIRELRCSVGPPPKNGCFNTKTWPIRAGSLSPNPTPAVLGSAEVCSLATAAVAAEDSCPCPPQAAALRSAAPASPPPAAPPAAARGAVRGATPGGAGEQSGSWPWAERRLASLPGAQGCGIWVKLIELGRKMLRTWFWYKIRGTHFGRKRL